MFRPYILSSKKLKTNVSVSLNRTPGSKYVCFKKMFDKLYQNFECNVLFCIGFNERANLKSVSFCYLEICILCDSNVYLVISLWIWMLIWNYLINHRQTTKIKLFWLRHVDNNTSDAYMSRRIKEVSKKACVLIDHHILRISFGTFIWFISLSFSLSYNN